MTKKNKVIQWIKDAEAEYKNGLPRSWFAELPQATQKEIKDATRELVNHSLPLTALARVLLKQLKLKVGVQSVVRTLKLISAD